MLHKTGLPWPGLAPRPLTGQGEVPLFHLCVLCLELLTVKSLPALGAAMLGSGRLWNGRGEAKGPVMLGSGQVVKSKDQVGTDGAKESWLGRAEVAWRGSLPYSEGPSTWVPHGDAGPQPPPGSQGPEVGTTGCLWWCRPLGNVPSDVRAGGLRSCINV